MPKGQPISDPINSGDRDEDERRGQSIEQRMSKNNSSKSLKSMLTPKKQGPKEDTVQEQVGRMEISKVKYKLIAGLWRGPSHHSAAVAPSFSSSSSPSTGIHWLAGSSVPIPTPTRLLFGPRRHFFLLFPSLWTAFAASCCLRFAEGELTLRIVSLSRQGGPT
jgi:hypothetical protein